MRRSMGITVWKWLRGASILLMANSINPAVDRGSRDPDRLWATAERTFLIGDWKQARALLGEIEKFRPKNPLDWVLLSQLELAEGHFASALAALSQVSDSHPIAPQAHLLAGRVHRQLRRIRLAEAEFRHALRLKPRMIDAHKELIYILGIQSRRSEIDAEFHALAQLIPLSHHDLFTWSLTHFTHWNPDIVADLDSFIKADPDDRLSRLALVGLILERPNVESYIEQVLRPLPDSDLDALALRITLAFNLGRMDQAEQLLALAASKSHPRIARIRGEIALRRHDSDAAIAHFQEAQTAEPYDRVAPMLLAQAYRLKGDVTAATAILERLKPLNRLYNLIIRVKSPKGENRVTPLAELGSACEAAGLLVEAESWYRLAVLADPLDSTAQKGLHRIRRARQEEWALAAGSPPAARDRAAQRK
jgi:tetratricopeptide (TPR) repeat protein